MAPMTTGPGAAEKRRLDLELVARGLAPSRTVAKVDIEAGLVSVDGAVVTKSATKVDPAQSLTVHRDERPYVGRAGIKLAAGLDAFGIDAAGARCIDAGASTGGFSDCLLRRKAASIVAVDVGTGQLHPSIRGHERVNVREQTDIRSLQNADVGGPVDLVVVDLSFISLRNVLPALAPLVDSGGSLLVLVKPQFEAGRKAVAAGRGVIREPSLWRRVLIEVTSAASELGLSLRGATVSPITGASGNVEFMVWFQPAGPPTAIERVRGETMIEAAVAEAETRIS
ncbi:MAG: TlyA family RNA methyltransferase [Acidimicrobiales bacterium]